MALTRHKQTKDKTVDELAFTQLFDLADELLYKLQKIDHLMDQIHYKSLVCNCCSNGKNNDVSR